MTISEETTVVASADQVSSEVGGEMVALNLKSGLYYSLNRVGTRIWQLVQEPRRVGDVRDAIVEQFNVDVERCHRDVLRLIQELADKGLVKVIDSASSP